MPRQSPKAKRRARLHKAAMGRREAAKNDPTRITQPLTPKLLERELKSATELEFGDTERQIQGEQRASDLHNTRIGSWFDQYQAKVREGQQRTAQVYQQSQAAMQQGAQAAGQQDNAQLQQVQSQGQADAASRGATMDPGASLMAQQAIAARGTSAATQSNLLGTQGANQGAYMIDQERIGARSGIEERGKESARRRTLDNTMRDVQKKKGEFKVKYTKDARDTERKYGLEQAVILGDSQQAAAKEQGDRAADRSASRDRRAGQATTRRGQDISSADRAAAERGRNARDANNPGGGRSGGPTPAKRAEMREKFEKGVGLARGAGFGGKAGIGKGATTVTYLLGENIPRLLARAAAEHAAYGGVSPKVAKAVRKRYGIGVKVLRGDKNPRLR